MNLLSKIDAINWLPQVSDQTSGLLGLKFAFEQKLFKLPANSSHLNQVHGTKIIPVEDVLQAADKALIKADGLFTKSTDQKIYVKTADCLPVILIDEQQLQAMVIHAGWRGLTAGIIQEGLKIFEDQGITMQSIRVLMGPCISEQHFEIGSEVAEAFLKANFTNNYRDNYLTISKGSLDRWHANLQLAASLIFMHYNIPPQQIFADQRCTYANKQLNSYRRDRENRGNNYSWVEL